MRWERELPWIARPLGALPSNWRERARVWYLAFRDLPRTMREDALTEMAAGMAFYLLFGLFPLLLCLVTLLPHLPLEAPVERLFEVSRPLLPSEVYDLLTGHIEGLVSQPRTGLLTASALVALWSASRAMVSLSRALNRAYRVDRIRSELLRRMRSMALTLAALLGVILAVLALSLGDWIVDLIVYYGWLPVRSKVLVLTVRWPLLLMVSSFLVQQLYYVLPDQRPRWRVISVGSLFAVVSWVVETWLFTQFATKFIAFNVTYGSLGTVAVVMAWMYLGCLSLMLGASVNALVDRGLPPSAPTE
ncbi:MAG TPA: hypothetical protein DIU15_10310 [Deltaproteobacteria bacterium]|nr:hypothetical protein [Deltaproteobacteria bacterium]HCP46427.1 hypothetical protein [Deltaproteobacteria bacterium]